MGKHIQSKFNIKQSQKTKDTIQKDWWINCRICFQQMDANKVPNICNCKQQESGVHQSCLSQWIKSAAMHEEGLFSYYTWCTVCKAKIYLTTKTTYKCMAWKRMDFCQKQLCSTMVMGLFFLIGIFMVVSSLFLLQNSPNDQVVVMLSCSSIVIGSIITFLDVLSFVYLLMISKEVQATGIKGVQLQETQQKNNPEIAKNLQSPNDSYAKLSIEITSEQMLEDITDF